mmetsp:Transcript_64207/g.178079  ORF Transcript_64207/g.178079 Transcript_64207/m.178079 type:complete len:224 (-) Transcript_64207:2-673(-)
MSTVLAPFGIAALGSLELPLEPPNTVPAPKSQRGASRSSSRTACKSEMTARKILKASSTASAGGAGPRAAAANSSTRAARCAESPHCRAARSSTSRIKGLDTVDVRAPPGTYCSQSRIKSSRARCSSLWRSWKYRAEAPMVLPLACSCRCAGDVSKSKLCGDRAAAEAPVGVAMPTPMLPAACSGGATSGGSSSSSEEPTPMAEGGKGVGWRGEEMDAWRPPQ